MLPASPALRDGTRLAVRPRVAHLILPAVSTTAHDIAASLARVTNPAACVPVPAFRPALAHFTHPHRTPIFICALKGASRRAAFPCLTALTSAYIQTATASSPRATASCSIAVATTTRTTPLISSPGTTPSSPQGVHASSAGGANSIHSERAAPCLDSQHRCTAVPSAVSCLCVLHRSGRRLIRPKGWERPLRDAAPRVIGRLPACLLLYTFHHLSVASASVSVIITMSVACVRRASEGPN